MPFSTKKSDRNFEIALLFIIVERPNNYVVGCNTTPPPTDAGKRSLSYKMCSLLMHSIYHWDACIHFRVRGVGPIFCFGFFDGRIFHGEGSFQGVNLWEEITHWGNFPESFNKIIFMSCFLFSFSILREEWLRVIVRGKFSLGLKCLEKISVGRGFSVEVGPDFLALFKKRSEMK